jgi:hypothetical protein
MNSFNFRVFDGRAKYLVAVVALLLVTIMPALASADQVTDRSIQLSNASAGSTNVTYTVNFKPVKDAAAFVINFCSNTPLLGEACTPPSGLSLTTATATTTNFTDESALNAYTMRVTGDMTAGNAVSVNITGVTNPAAGQLYARIVTYDTAAHADAYAPDSAAEGAAGVQDNGGAALYITPTIGVSGSVLESMTFCVAGDADRTTPANPITTGSCNGGATLPAPTVKLGTVVGEDTVLDSTSVYEGKIYTQISTNAVSGAVISLKSNTLGCGGLSRAGATSFATGCGIAPALAAGISQGQALFGVKTGTAAGIQDVSDGTLQAAGGGSAYYNGTTFKMNWITGDATGVTSPYGDPFLDTAGAPVNNMGMAITFGASAANNTPAGKYSADLSLIATGKF